MRIFEGIIGCFLCYNGYFCGLILIFDSLMRED